MDHKKTINENGLKWEVLCHKDSFLPPVFNLNFDFDNLLFSILP